MQIIYCAGGNKRFAEIAMAAGFRYGSRAPGYTIYAPPFFLDQDWKQPDKAAYMAALAEYRPEMATVLDLERPEQLGDVLTWAEEAMQHTRRVLIIPKYSGAIDNLPRRIGHADVVLAFSVPTRYGGTEVPIWEFAGWPIHLLGGSPQAQMHYAAHLNAIAEVVSADGNMANLQAHHCRFWSAETNTKGHWWQLSDVGDVARGDDANIRAFRRSCENIYAAWQG